MHGGGPSPGTIGTAAGGGAKGLSVVTSYQQSATQPAQLMNKAIRKSQQIRRWWVRVMTRQPWAIREQGTPGGERSPSGRSAPAGQAAVRPRAPQLSRISGSADMAKMCIKAHPSRSPIDDRPVVLVVALRAPPLVPDLVGQGGVVQLDPQSGACRHVHEPALHHERLLQVTLAERAVLLARESGMGRRERDARRKGDWSEWVVRGDRRVIRLGHSGDEAALRDPSGVAQVRLENGRGLLLQHFAEPPLREHA